MACWFGESPELDQHGSCKHHIRGVMAAFPRCFQLKRLPGVVLLPGVEPFVQEDGGGGSDIE